MRFTEDSRALCVRQQDFVGMQDMGMQADERGSEEQAHAFLSSYSVFELQPDLMELT